MNRKITKTLESPLKIYANLKFNEIGASKIKPGTLVELEDTGKIFEDENGNKRSIFRIRKKTRNYYVLDL